MQAPGHVPTTLAPVYCSQGMLSIIGGLLSTLLMSAFILSHMGFDSEDLFVCSLLIRKSKSKEVMQSEVNHMTNVRQRQNFSTEGQSPVLSPLSPLPSFTVLSWVGFSLSNFPAVEEKHRLYRQTSRCQHVTPAAPLEDLPYGWDIYT